MQSEYFIKNQMDEYGSIPNGEIKVAEWDKFLDEIDQTENIFQLNCGKLDKSSGFISTSLSSSSLVYLQTLIIMNWLLISRMI